MPRKQKLDEMTDQDMTQQSASQPAERNYRSPSRISLRKVNDIPLAEIIPEGETDQNESDLPQFMPAAESPASSDELDFAIRQARSESVPAESSLDYGHVREKLAPRNAPRANLFSTDISQPPITVLGASIIMIIVFLAFS